MSEKLKSSEKDPALIETPKGADYRAVIDTENGAGTMGPVAWVALIARDGREWDE